MTKLTRSLALAGMMAVAAGSMSLAESQEPKAKKAVKKGGTVKVKQSEKTDKFYISIYDTDDKYVGGGRASGYETKEDVTKGIEAIKNALDGAKLEYLKGGEKDDDKDEPKKKDAKKKEKDKDEEKKEEPKKTKKGG